MAESKDTGNSIRTRTAFDIAAAVESSQIHLTGLNKTLWFCVANAEPATEKDGNSKKGPELLEHVFALTRAMEMELQNLSAVAGDVYALARKVGTNFIVSCEADRK